MRLDQFIVRLNQALLMASMPFVLAACFHGIRFEDINYSLNQTLLDASLLAVISPETLAQRKTIRVGLITTWETLPGEMLKQIAEVEFPQKFKYYRTASAYDEPKEGLTRLIVELSLQYYDFSESHASVVVIAKAYGPGHASLWEKSYREEGFTQRAKMHWGGLFAMKSAIRQSSFDAYKKVFARLRTDLARSTRIQNTTRSQEEIIPVPRNVQPRASQPVERKDAGQKSGPCQRTDRGLICREESDYSLH
jgi:hypothetical protein